MDVRMITNIDDLNGTKDQGHRHDIAYICFLPPGLLSLIAAIASVIPMDTGMAGGVGFLLLIPLTLVALISVPTAIYLSMELRRDFVLPILSVLTISMFAELMLEAGPILLRKVTYPLYGILILIFEIIWFLHRRRLIYPK